MNVPRGGRQLFASMDAERQSYANLARIWSTVPKTSPAVPVPDPAGIQSTRHLRAVA